MVRSQRRSRHFDHGPDLVDLQSHGKARVATVDLHEANEIYELRLLIEPAALERAVRNADDDYRDRVERAWIDLSQTPIPPPSIHANFHRALLSNCDSDWMLRLSTMLADRAGLMISTSVERQAPDYNSAETVPAMAEACQATHVRAVSENEVSRFLRTRMVDLHIDAGGIADLVVLDAQRLVDGPICNVTMPGPTTAQIHGW